ncbi:MAG: hypothetical protein JJU20_02150, partial [Opitutales bacterium]|nr:hypothetical protein [Opitutales bacterium]
RPRAGSGALDWTDEASVPPGKARPRAGSGALDWTDEASVPRREDLHHINICAPDPTFHSAWV